jgi:hypothetical protein
MQMLINIVFGMLLASVTLGPSGWTEIAQAEVAVAEVVVPFMAMAIDEAAHGTALGVAGALSSPQQVILEPPLLG